MNININIPKSGLRLPITITIIIIIMIGRGIIMVCTEPFTVYMRFVLLCRVGNNHPCQRDSSKLRCQCHCNSSLTFS